MIHLPMTLDQVDVSSWVYIKKIDDDLLHVRLGIFLTHPRQPVFVKRKLGAAGGICLKISETLIGIRTQDAKKIYVESIPPASVAKICD